MSMAKKKDLLITLHKKHCFFIYTQFIPKKHSLLHTMPVSR